LVVHGQDRLVHAPLSLRHRQYRTARDLPGRRRHGPLGFGTLLLSQPARDSFRDSKFRQLVADLLQLLAQLLCPRLQFGPAGRDQSRQL
jgi:hypothetical protein